jgi:hypothetical protein
VRTVARRYIVFYEKLTPGISVSVVEIGINLTCLYIGDPKQHRAIEQEI